ncbi:carbohydrate ABC transporter permease [Diplocloster modestus]|uniref:Carbohydrate ABC transporter permease n=1 Tax=Diplocloster modestus TaxID=2850322 RepID=A0ABS6KEX8_9FIRM|nr:carbohydrate ABC transporter permease [Diplocloster modestus]MBU9729024.1 carbohydrate ABC transporter permease [Diplocloster modestus]
MKKKITAIDVFSYGFISALTLVSLLPMLMIVVASFTDNNTILREGYSFFPKQWSAHAYLYIFASGGDVVRSYGVTVLITAVGSGAGLFVTALAGYVLNCKKFKYRNKFSFFFYFTTLFSGGLVPFYIMVATVLGLKDSLLAVILPGLTSPFLIIIMRSFITTTIPDSLMESMRMDGATDFTIFGRLVLPLMKPALATVGLFLALNYWNGWYLPMLFLNRPRDFPIQYYLHTMMSVQRMAATSGAAVQGMQFPGESIKMAMAVAATAPILFAYPFVQRYFVEGLTVGAVKE